jgi:hypothetical protein
MSYTLRARIKNKIISEFVPPPKKLIKLLYFAAVCPDIQLKEDHLSTSNLIKAAFWNRVNNFIKRSKNG